MKQKKYRLEKALMKEHIATNDWQGEVDYLNKVLNQLSFVVYFDENSNQYGSSVCCNYYSKKIKHSVVLEWDAYADFESYAEMAEFILDYEKKARRLERSIKINKKL